MKYFLLVLVGIVSLGISYFQFKEEKSVESKPQVTAYQKIQENLSQKGENLIPFAGLFMVPIQHYEVSSGFGPRLKASKGFVYDFHRGIDYHGELGENILSVYDGELYKYYSEDDPKSPYQLLGTTVIIEHTLPQGFEFHGEKHSKIYSVYGHLSDVPEKIKISKSGTKIEKGEIVGYLGQTGDTKYNHLHFELRLATICSREYQLANPEKKCAQTLPNNADPHINPNIFFPIEIDHIVPPQISVLSKHPTVIKVSFPRDELIFNSISVGKNSILETVDFNLRENIHNVDRDNNEFNDIIISPEKFSTDTKNYEITFTFKNIENPDLIQIGDIYGNFYTY